MMMKSPPTPSSTLTQPKHSQCSLRAQSSITKLGKHLNTANSDGIPSTKPLGMNPTQMKSSDSAKEEASILRNPINNGFKGPTPCDLSCSTTSHMTKKVTSHTHELSARYARPKPTPTAPALALPLEETPSTTLATAVTQQPPSKLSNWWLTAHSQLLMLT